MTRFGLNSLPNDKFSDCSKLKAFADNKLNLPKKLNLSLESVENIVGKAENADYQHFILFPQCFQKASILGSLKVRIANKIANIAGKVENDSNKHFAHFRTILNRKRNIAILIIP